MDINYKVSKNGQHVDVGAYDLDGNVIGLVRLKADPGAAVRNIESLYIDFWATNPNYKGIGREMLRNIVKISNNSGFNGRVSLNACTGSVPSEFSRICGNRKMQDVACAIKYKKMGFNSRLPELDKRIEQAIQNGETGFEMQSSALGNGFRDTLSGPMDLSPEFIKKYLGFSGIS